MTYDRIALIAITAAAVAFGAARAVTPMPVSLAPTTAYNVSAATQLSGSTVGVFILKSQGSTAMIYYCSAPTQASATQMTACRGQQLP